MDGEAGSSEARPPGSPSDPAAFTDMFAPPKRSRAASFLARSTAAAPCAAASVVARAVAAVAAVRPEAGGGGGGRVRVPVVIVLVALPRLRLRGRRHDDVIAVQHGQREVFVQQVGVDD